MLFHFLLLTSLFCHVTLQGLRTRCEGEDLTQYARVECTNIKNITTLTDFLATVNLVVQDILITDSPQLVLSSDDLSDTRLRDLKYVFIVENQLSTFNPEPFRRFNLEIFSLGGNKLVSINSTTFQEMSTVKKLNLMENRITSIDSSAFKGFHNLSILYLNDNMLASIGDNVFDGVALVDLNLADNLLTTLGERLFHGIKKLEILRLGDNKIRTIDYRAFQTLGNLSRVELSGNDLEGFDSRLFQNTNLLKLDLSINNLENITNFPINSATLRGLNLNRCKIHTIPVDYFENLPNLLVLQLESNKISSIDDNLFRPLRELRILKLGRNYLTSLSVAGFQQMYRVLTQPPTSVDAFTFSSDVKAVNMAANPWNCSTKDMTELRTWTSKHNVNFNKLFNCS